MEGKGKYFFPFCEYYEGFIKKGKREGMGYNKLANGTIYECEWKNNMRNRKGINKSNTGVIYE